MFIPTRPYLRHVLTCTLKSTSWSYPHSIPSSCSYPHAHNHVMLIPAHLYPLHVQIRTLMLTPCLYPHTHTQVVFIPAYPHSRPHPGLRLRPHSYSHAFSHAHTHIHTHVHNRPPTSKPTLTPIPARPPFSAIDIDFRHRPLDRYFTTGDVIL